MAIILYYKIVGYIPCVVQYIHISYFIHNNLYFLVPYPYIFLLLFLSPLVITSLFSIFVGLFLFCYIH